MTPGTHLGNFIEQNLLFASIDSFDQAFAVMSNLVIDNHLLQHKKLIALDFAITDDDICACHCRREAGDQLFHHCLGTGFHGIRGAAGARARQVVEASHRR